MSLTVSNIQISIATMSSGASDAFGKGEVFRVEAGKKDMEWSDRIYSISLRRISLDLPVARNMYISFACS